jgi:hypothetical protein
VRLHAEEMWDRFLYKCSMRVKGKEGADDLISVPGKAFPELQGKRDDEGVREKELRSPQSPLPPRQSEKEPRSPPRSRTFPRTQARYEHYRKGSREKSRGDEARHTIIVNGRREEVSEGRYSSRHHRIDRYRTGRSQSPMGRRPERRYERYRN